MTIKIAILGYGNLGKGVELAIQKNPDMDLVAIFTRRNPLEVNVNSQTPVISVNEIMQWQNKIDVLILCGGSATDLPVQTPKFAEFFNVVDSFDTHARISEHFNNVNLSSNRGKKTAIISAGWDPGLFSLNRLYANSILPDGKDYTFWGKGVSQGHSDAIRRIEGVKDAKQYTIPIEKALNSVRNGCNPDLKINEKHKRECFVVLQEGANPDLVREKIVNMPNYFADYDTIVHFITEEDMKRNHSSISHGGCVIRCRNTTESNKQIIEYNLKLDSNPEFTSSVLVAFARAACRLNKSGQYGCKTIFDVPPVYLSNKTPEELRATIL